MPDVVDAVTRSRMMSGIKGRDTKPEMQIRRMLHRAGFRYRLHARDLPGHPDIVLPKYHAVIFVHGCFWHGHSCPLFKWPKSRAAWWREKIERNMAKDEEAQLELRALGWRIGVVWECALKGRDRLPPRDVADILIEWLRGDESNCVVRGERAENK